MTNYCTSILFSILKSITCVGFFREKNLISLTEGLLCNSREQPSYSGGIDWEASWMETLFNGPLWGQFKCSRQFVGMSVDVGHLVFFCQAKLVPLSLQLVNRAFRIGCQFCACGIWLPKCTKSPQKAKQRCRSTNSGSLCVLWKLFQNTAEVERKEAMTSSSQSFTASLLSSPAYILCACATWKGRRAPTSPFGAVVPLKIPAFCVAPFVSLISSLYFATRVLCFCWDGYPWHNTL